MESFRNKIELRPDEISSKRMSLNEYTKALSALTTDGICQLEKQIASASTNVSNYCGPKSKSSDLALT